MQRLKVLIVEDSESSQKSIQDILSPYGDCDSALDGISAVGKFRDALFSDKPYDVVFMDITMPQMDGKTALSIIRGIEDQKGAKQTPVIMTTAVGDAMSKIEAMHELHATSYLMKPIAKEALLKELNKLKILVTG